MEQFELFVIKSPCIGVCQADNKGYCLGCFRNRQERFHWKELNNAQKQHVIKLCKRRAMRRLQQKNQVESTADAKKPKPQQLDFFDHTNN